MLIRNVSLLLLLAACGGKVADNEDAGDAAPIQGDSSPKPPVSDAQPPTPIDDASTECNNLDPLGKPAPIQQVASDPPPIGGTQASFGPGVYVVTSITIYTGPSGPSGAMGTVDAITRISSAKNGWIAEVAAQSNQEAVSRSSSTFVITGPGQLQSSQFCPAITAPATDASFAYSGNQLTLRIATDGQTVDEQLVLVTK